MRRFKLGLNEVGDKAVNKIEPSEIIDSDNSCHKSDLTENDNESIGDNYFRKEDANLQNPILLIERDWFASKLGDASQRFTLPVYLPVEANSMLKSRADDFLESTTRRIQYH